MLFNCTTKHRGGYKHLPVPHPATSTALCKVDLENHPKPPDETGAWFLEETKPQINSYWHRPFDDDKMVTPVY